MSGIRQAVVLGAIPIVVGLLVFVGSRQDPVLGFLLFFALALGMGAPYVGLAVAAGRIRSLPRSGEWLVWTERLFGWILLCLAAYFVGPLFPPSVGQYLLPGVAALAGLYLGFLEPAGRAVPRFAESASRSSQGPALRLPETNQTPPGSVFPLPNRLIQIRTSVSGGSHTSAHS